MAERDTPQMNDDRRAAAAPEELLGQVANEFFERLAQGENPQIQEYERQYPELAEQIRVTFPALELVGESLSSPPGTQSPLDLAVEQQLGDFRIVRELGRGGMGVVYEAEQISMGRRVALKVLPFATLAGEKMLKRFRNEVRAAATLDHPNIVSVFSVGEDRGIHYYAMQLVRGTTLAAVIEHLKERPGDSARSPHGARDSKEAARPADETKPIAAATTMPERRSRGFYLHLAQLGISAAEALHHAHEQGIVHRDIKPANLLVDTQGMVHITDFGLARIEAEAGVTMTGDLVGTLRYMAPEQALGKHVVIDHRADIYSLAATLYECAALRPVFAGADRRQLLKQIAFDEPKSLLRANPAVPNDLETIISKGLQKDAGDRYQTATELAEDLRRFAGHQPIIARPPSLFDRVAKWSRRNQKVVWTTTGVVCLSCIALMIVSVSLFRAYSTEISLRTQVSTQLHRATKAERSATAAQQAADHQREVARRSLYLAHMRLAKHSWSLGQVAHVHELLTRHIPEVGESDLRNWEWYYLLGNCYREQRSLRDVGDDIGDLAWSPNGERLAARIKDGTIVVWGPQGRLQTKLIGAGVDGRSVSWSPDGNRVASSGDRDQSGWVRVWNVDVSNEPTILRGRRGVVSTLAWHPNANLVAVVLARNEGEVINIWDLARQEVVLEIAQTDPSNRVLDICWSADGTQLLCGHRNGYASLWDALKGEKVRTWRPHEFDVFVAWSPAATHFATAGFEGSIRIWDTTNLEELQFIQNDSEVVDFSWAGDGKSIAVASNSGRVDIWNALDGTRKTVVQGHLGRTRHAAWNATNDVLATAATDKAVKLWHLSRTEGLEFEMVVAGGIQWSPDDQQLALGTKEGEVLVVDVEKRSIVCRFSASQHHTEHLSPQWSRDGKMVAVQAGPEKIIVWSVPAVEVVAELAHPSPRHGGEIWSVAWSPDGESLATVNYDLDATDRKNLRVWDTHTWTERVSCSTTTSQPTCVSFSPDGSLVAVGNFQGPIDLFETRDWKRTITLIGHTRWAETLAWTSDGKTIASGGQDGVIRIWDVDAGREVSSMLGHTAIIKQLQWNHDETRIMSSSNDGSCRLWDVTTGEQVIELAANQTPTFAAVSSSGMMIAVACQSKVTLHDANRGYEVASSQQYLADRASAMRARSVELANSRRFEDSDAFMSSSEALVGLDIRSLIFRARAQLAIGEVKRSVGDLTRIPVETASMRELALLASVWKEVADSTWNNKSLEPTTVLAYQRAIECAQRFPRVSQTDSLRARHTLVHSAARLASLFLQSGQSDRARRTAQIGLQASQGWNVSMLPSPYEYGFALSKLAEVLLRLKEFQHAEQVQRNILQGQAWIKSNVDPVDVAPALDGWTFADTMKLAQALHAQRETKAATELVDKSLQSDELKENTHATLECVWHVLRMPTASPEHLKQCLALVQNIAESGSLSAYWRPVLGLAYFRAGEHRRALTEFEASKGGRLAEYFFLMSMCHGQLGNGTDATRFYNRGMKWLEDNRADGLSFLYFMDEARLVSVPRPAKRSDDIQSHR